jgi:outer membrane protein OmpA-like peptidoglycan-associated protein
MKKLFLGVVATAALVAACATDPNTGQAIYGNTGRGAVIGGLAGAAAGVLAGGNDGRNAAVGAAVGALAGAGIGRYMDGQEEELRRATTTSGVTLVRNGNQIELRMPADVTFATAQDSIKPQFYPIINDVAKILVRYPKTTIDIVGHADSDGADQMNQDLSERRARSVGQYLTGQGVQPIRIRTYGRGESEPLVPNTSPANKAMNRRVQILLNPVTE